MLADDAHWIILLTPAECDLAPSLAAATVLAERSSRQMQLVARNAWGNGREGAGYGGVDDGAVALPTPFPLLVPLVSTASPLLASGYVACSVRGQSCSCAAACLGPFVSLRSRARRLAQLRVDLAL